MMTRPDAGTLHPDVVAARDGDADARARVVGALAWAGFVAPAAVRPVYDLFAAAWLGEPLTRENAVASNAELAQAQEAPVPDSFWDALAQVLTGPDAGYDAASITGAVAALGGAVSPRYQQLAEADAATWPGSTDAAQRQIPGFLDLRPLAVMAEGTLGRTLHDVLVENGYDLEVLDRDAIQLGALPPALCYLNTRILQMHDVWHLVAGYTTSGSHEIAISAFQLAQFGHNYSAMFLAVVSAITHTQRPEGFAVIGLLTAEAWRHGRATPPLMAIAWEQEWARDIDAIRADHQIPVYQSVLPTNLFEMAKAG